MKIVISEYKKPTKAQGSCLWDVFTTTNNLAAASGWGQPCLNYRKICPINSEQTIPLGYLSIMNWTGKHWKTTIDCLLMS
jgi:hypothetical protein